MTQFKHFKPVLTCNNCGAQIPVEQLNIEFVICEFCTARNLLVPISTTKYYPTFTQAELSESERIILLQMQIEESNFVQQYENITDWYDRIQNGPLPEEDIHEVVSLWHELYANLQIEPNIETSNNFITLTSIINIQYKKDTSKCPIENLEHRALNIVILPEHKQKILNNLFMNSFRKNDFEQAQNWVNSMVQDSTILSSDSIFRVSLALLFASKKEWGQVISALEYNHSMVPIEYTRSANVTFLLATALEKTGQNKKSISLICNLLFKIDYKTLQHIYKKTFCAHLFDCQSSLEKAIKKYEKEKYGPAGHFTSYATIKAWIVALFFCIAGIVTSTVLLIKISYLPHNVTKEGILDIPTGGLLFTSILYFIICVLFIGMCLFARKHKKYIG